MGATATLSDVIRAVGGWPIDLDRVTDALDLADDILAAGRDHHGPLTTAELGVFCARFALRRP